jgi:hypothetical protein
MWRAGAPFPDGHFYSPVVSREEIWPRRESLWKDELTNPGIDYAPEKQRRFIDEDLREALKLYDYPAEKPGEGRFYDTNPAFSWVDARSLFTMLLKHRPRRVIEIGAGYSTLLTADVNTRHLNGSISFTTIEPYPMPFLEQPIEGLRALHKRQVQSVPASYFADLSENDILFIDSSHVSKTGSDFNYLVFDVLPTLQRGVLIHFHDVFLPREYPPQWVFNEGRSWNEQYVLRALLIGSNMFEVEFGSSFAFYAFPELLREVLGGRLFGGGSFWIRKIR